MKQGLLPLFHQETQRKEVSYPRQGANSGGVARDTSHTWQALGQAGLLSLLGRALPRQEAIILQTAIVFLSECGPVFPKRPTHLSQL